jgi:hypothetical protein
MSFTQLEQILFINRKCWQNILLWKVLFCLMLVQVDEYLFQKWVQGGQPCTVECNTNWCVSITKQTWTCSTICYEKEWGSITRQEGGIVLHIWWNVSNVMVHGFYVPVQCYVENQYCDLWRFACSLGGMLKKIKGVKGWTESLWALYRCCRAH